MNDRLVWGSSEGNRLFKKQRKRRKKRLSFESIYACCGTRYSGMTLLLLVYGCQEISNFRIQSISRNFKLDADRLFLNTFVCSSKRGNISA